MPTSRDRLIHRGLIRRAETAALSVQRQEVACSAGRLATAAWPACPQMTGTVNLKVLRRRACERRRLGLNRLIRAYHPSWLVRVRSLLAYRSRASSISRSTSSGYDTPLAAHSLGYMLMEVKPGIVLISLM